MTIDDSTLTLRARGTGDGPLAGLKSVAVEAQAAGQVEARPVGSSPGKGTLMIGLYLPTG